MVACTVRDLSMTGAAVEIADLDTKVIPATFNLVVPEDRLRLSCRLVWRAAFKSALRSFEVQKGKSRHDR